MPDATVNIGGDASGALAAVAAAQGAIDSLHGKTVIVDIDVREHGSSSGGVGRLAAGLGQVGNAADRAGRSARGMGDNFDRAGRSARGMGDHLGRAGDHVGRMADDAGRMRTHMDAVNNIMSGGAPGMVSHAQGMRQMAVGAALAAASIAGIGTQSSRSLGALNAGAGRAGDGLKSISSGAQSANEQVAKLAETMRKSAAFSVASSGRIGGSAGQASRLGSGDQTGQRASTFAVDSSGNISSRLAGASTAMERFTGSAAGMGSALGGSGKEMERFGSRAGELTRHVGGMGRTIDAVGRSIDGGGSGGGLGGLMNKLGGLPDVAMPSMMAMRGVGLTAGIAALGMGALGAAVAGVGLAGVAADFAHNNQLMHAGKDAVKDFNKEFSAMKGATSAAGMPAMAGVAASMKGVGHELAAIGAANMGSVLGSVASLGNQATQAMHKLAPSIGPATQGLTALAGAVIGAFGDSGPAVTSFANTITKNAAGLQALTSSVIDTAGAVGNATVDMAGGAGQFDSGVGSPSGKPPGSAIDTGGKRSLAGMAQTALMLAMGGPLLAPLGAAGSGMDAFSGGGGPSRGAPVAPGAFDASKPFSGQVANDNAGTSFTPGTGSGEAPKTPAPQRSLGNFGPGSGGPMTPSIAGRSPDAAQYDGMTGSQIYNKQYANSTGAPSGAPHWDGTGPGGPTGGGMGMGPGSAFRPTPAALGGGGTALPGLMASMQAASSGGNAIGGELSRGIAQSAGGGAAATGGAMVQHVQKAVSTAAPAAVSGGAAVGGGIGGGMASGTSSSMTVVDTVMVKHVKHVIETAAAVLGIHSPSTEFDYLARMTWAGFGRGSDREAPRTFGAMSDHMGGVLSAAQGQAKFGYDNQDVVSPTVSVRKPSPKDEAASYDDYKASVEAQQAAADRKASFGDRQYGYKPGSEGWWAAHNNRAGQLGQRREQNQRAAIGGMTHDERRDMLLQNRAGNRERALANLHITGHPKQSGDVNPFAAEQARSKGLNAALNPFSQLPGMFNKTGHDSALGLSQGMNAHVGKIQAAGSNLAGAGHGGYKKKDKQSSPSAAWAEMAGNSAAGAVQGMNAGAPAMAAAGAAAAGAMQAATAGPMSDSGLVVGYTWAQNVETGISTQIKKANYQSLGLPSGLGQAGVLGLAATGLLKAGSGASSYKTPGNAPGVVTLPSATNQTVTVNHNFDLGGQVVQAVTQITLDMFGQVTDAIALQPST